MGVIRGSMLTVKTAKDAKSAKEFASAGTFQDEYFEFVPFLSRLLSNS